MFEPTYPQSNEEEELRLFLDSKSQIQFTRTFGISDEEHTRLKAQREPFKKLSSTLSKVTYAVSSGPLKEKEITGFHAAGGKPHALSSRASGLVVFFPMLFSAYHGCAFCCAAEARSIATLHV